MQPSKNQPSYEQLAAAVQQFADAAQTTYPATARTKATDLLHRLAAQMREEKSKTQVFIPLIGIVGHTRSGKDTIAHMLVKQYGYKRVAFADQVKLDLFDLFVRATAMDHAFEGVGISEMNQARESWLSYLELHKYDGPTSFSGWARQMVRWYAEWCKDIHEERLYWVNKVKLEPGVVVSDVRFLPEALAIRKANGRLVRVVRPKAAGDAHISETEQDLIDVDWTIENNGTLQGLAHRVQSWQEDVQRWLREGSLNDVREKHGIAPISTRLDGSHE